MHGEAESGLPSVEAINHRWKWTPIRNCPGRYVLAGGANRLSILTLVGRGIPVVEFASARARDPVFVAHLADGGIISYLRPDGSMRHTLCTQMAFERKLRDLGLHAAIDADGHAVISQHST
jgi:hypothetical protein